ncbi:MAG: DNA/RNA non-specific endonuclease [Sphingomonadales bacterium]|nr:DNA/RNA non-specific endonuclease [Sphingomonadales bacterium]MDE2170424.1 DNA/RNA non-specific endonuclease [Sphingomonadales bacterium]
MPGRFRLPLILLLILLAVLAWVAWHQQAAGPAAGPSLLPVPDIEPVAASQAACGRNLYQGAQPHLPDKMASGLTLVCYQGYASASSAITRTPLWSAEHLTARRIELARATERTSAFFPEPSLNPESRGELIDYRRSGFDRGHLSPSGDMPGHEAQRESFSLANIAPQNSELNRGPWADLESRLRDYAMAQGDLWVVTGVLFQGERINTTPDGRVMVPTSFWKAAMVPGKGGVVFLAPNDDSGTIQTLSLGEFAERTGIMPFPRIHDTARLEVD